MLAGKAILLTFLAEVSVGADRAHVTNTDDRVSVTAVADDLIMAGLLLLSLLIIKIVGEHLAEAVVAVVLNFLSDDLGDCRKLLGYDRASAVALAAGQALLVHLRAVALDAGDFLEVRSVLIFRRDQEVACDVSLFHLDFHLAGLVLHIRDNAVAAHVTDLHVGLAGIVSSSDTGVDHDVTGLDAGSVAAGFDVIDHGATSANRH